MKVVYSSNSVLLHSSSQVYEPSVILLYDSGYLHGGLHPGTW